MTECPNCGSRELGFRPGPYDRVTAFFCFECQFTWLQYGEVHTRESFLHSELTSFKESLLVYLRIAVTVWAIASLLLLLLMFAEPVSAFTRLGTNSLAIIEVCFSGGVLLGIGLAVAIFAGGALRKQFVIFLLPLFWSGLIGGAQVLILSKMDWLLANAGLSLRSTAMTIPAGILMGFAVTPIVIIRSSKACRRKGLRPPPAKDSEDPRWEF